MPRHLRGDLFSALGDICQFEIVLDGVSIDDERCAGAIHIRQVVHQIEHELIKHCTQGAGTGFTLECSLGEQPQRIVGEFQRCLFEAEQVLILLDNGVLGLGHDLHEGIDIQRHQRRDDREAADELGDQAELEDVFGSHLSQQLCLLFLCVLLLGDFSGEADATSADAAADDVFKAGKRSTADEQDVGGVHLDVLLFGVLAAALWGHVGHSAFEHFQQGLLDALAGDIACDGYVLIGFADLVYFVDVNNAALGCFEIVIRGLEELQEQVFDVLANITGFGEGGGIADGKWDVEYAGERLGEQGFSCAGWTDEQDVGLVQFDGRLFVIDLGEALVVVVYGDSERLLGVVLADDVLVEEFLDLPRGWDR